MHGKVFGSASGEILGILKGSGKKGDGLGFKFSIFENSDQAPNFADIQSAPKVPKFWTQTLFEMKK